MKTRNWPSRKLLRTVWIIAGITFTSWMFYSFQSHGVDGSLLKSDSRLSVLDNDTFFEFQPAQETKKVLIFYPGAMVDPKAYVPLCRNIALHNVNVYLIKMPWRLASKGYNLPKQLKVFNDTSKTYILAGHSQGAKMAAQFVYENPDLIDKLVLIGTTHPRDISLAQSTIPILKIYGTEDGVADEKTMIKNKQNLPASTRFVKIDGANHAQFGYYGFQLGDNSATITREQQQDETLKIILDFIK